MNLPFIYDSQPQKGIAEEGSRPTLISKLRSDSGCSCTAIICFSECLTSTQLPPPPTYDEVKLRKGLLKLSVTLIFSSQESARPCGADIIVISGPSPSRPSILSRQNSTRIF
jgi:hypothetical protein